MIRYATLAMLLLALTAPAAAVPTPAQDAEVSRSASLLATTFYRKIDVRSMLAAEERGLEQYARSSGRAAPRFAQLPERVDAKSAPDVAVAIFDAGIHAGLSGDGAMYAALKGMASVARDRYTVFLTPSEYQGIEDILDPAKLSGIGVLLDVDPSTQFVRAFFVVPDGPADKAGLKSGDLLVSVNGASTRGIGVPGARKLLLGASGTRVEIATQRPSDGTKSDLALTRADVRPPTVYFSMLPKNVAYVYVAAFGNDTPREFHTAIARSEAAGAKAYVVDLRNDGGGIVGTALSLASEFVPSGPLVSIESNGGEIETYEADDAAIPPKPLAVLVNGYSASASEIMAAAISESGAGVLVGTRTFGKGVVQTVTRFADGSALKITTGRYYTPHNNDINGRGIMPAFVVTENADAVFGTPTKDAQLDRALALLDQELSRS